MAAPGYQSPNMVAKQLGVDRSTITRWCKKGKNGPFPGAWQPNGFQGSWLIPVEDLLKMRGQS